MKQLCLLLFVIPCLSLAQSDHKKQVDSLKFVTNIPYVCGDARPTQLSTGCGDAIFWRIVHGKEAIIPFLIEKLSDTTQTDAIVPNFGGQYTVADIAYVALQEIIKGIPTFQLL